MKAKNKENCTKLCEPLEILQNLPIMAFRYQGAGRILTLLI